jgi:exonuclease VII small subunit
LRINIDLLRRVLGQIKTHPETWRQETWVSLGLTPGCGTRFCFAGHAAHMSGFAPRGLELDSSAYMGNLPPETVEALREWTRVYRPRYELSADYPIHVSVIASAVLGVNPTQATALFEGDNSLADLERIVSELIAQQEAIDEAQAQIERGRALAEQDQAAREVVCTAEAIVEEAALTEPVSA